MDRISLRKEQLTAKLESSSPKTKAEEILSKRRDFETFYRDLVHFVSENGGIVHSINNIEEVTGASRSTRLLNLQIIFREDKP